MGRVYLIEWRHKKESLYTWLDGTAIDSILADKPEIEVFHVDFKTALKLGNMVTTKRLTPSIIQTKQRSMGGYLQEK